MRATRATLKCMDRGKTMGKPMLQFKSPTIRQQRCHGRSGQALIIAVLLMSVILLVGILFAAVVSYNQQQSARHLDVVAAQLQAEAGVNYASAMLENSPQGADWRPRMVPYTGTGGEDPGDPSTWPTDPSTWPSPPARYLGATEEYDFNFWGPDGIQDTEDDYYSEFDMVRGWYPLRQGTRSNPGPFVRLGFHRFPDPNQFAPTSTEYDSTNLGRGYFLLQVTYDPDPPYEPGDRMSQDNMSGNTRIVSIGRAVEESNTFRRLTAYKPIGLMDHARWITNKSGDAQQAVLGVRPLVDLNFYSPATAAAPADQTNEEMPTNIEGSVRSEAPLYWTATDLDGTLGLPLTASFHFRLRTSPVTNEGYLRDDLLLAPEGLYSLDDRDGAAVQVDTGADLPLPQDLNPGATGAPTRVHVSNEDVTALAPVELDARDPSSGMLRYHALTRDSGQVVKATHDDPTSDVVAGDPVNTGMFGRGAGLYIDNYSDIQFRGADGRSDLNRLVNDWLKSPQGSAGVETGWDPTFTTYTPPAVEIEFFPSESAVLATSTSPTIFGVEPPMQAGVLWWPGHVAGAPGIKLTRHDKRWRRADNEGGAWHVGEESGRNVIVLDYPAYPNQVIYAEGNVRVKGVLPSTDPAVPALNRSFDVTVVSNGTIYIDGQLMTAQDVHGRRYGTNDPDATGILDEYTAKVALLAKDNVCLNPTQLVPELTSGMVTVAADDEANPTLQDMHWELYPDTAGTVWTQWRFGWPTQTWDGSAWVDGAPGDALPGDVRVMVTPIHAAADPGPSGMGIVTYRESPAPQQNSLNFGATAPYDPYTFMFVPPGALLGSVPSPTQYASNAIAPNWQAPGSTPTHVFANPVVPFDITADCNKTAGTANGVTMAYRDPQIGAGSTAYLVKKWKIEELRPDTDVLKPYQIPQGAVHAKVNALMYAQRGSWFVIPGQYFDRTAVTQDYNGNGVVDGQDSLYAARFARYNYEITVRGAITEDHTAPLEAAQTWMERWAYPIYTGGGDSLALAWGTIRYEFDERLRMNREQSPTALNGAVRSGAMGATVQSSLPKLPCLPSSPTLIYAGGTL
ncbi:MAG: hypothetical protein ABFD94_06235 [Armatimonadia bacterium]